ncbi:MAG: hypothetical protein KAT65_27935 [Methanophagales archaeon]|nr:hypothetical protein [Methanophagales archaeon]
MEKTKISDVKGTVLKPSYLSPRRSPRAQSLRAFQSTLGFSDASAFSAHSAVKLEDILILLENSTVQT